MYLFKIKPYKIKVSLLIALSILVVTSAFSGAVLAKDLATNRVPTEDLVEGITSRDGRWFEVELIIFKRTDNIELREQFSQNVESLIKPRQWDVVRDLLQPDVSIYLAGLPECHQDINPLANIEQTKFLSPQEFYKQMMDYQTLINRKWQFTNELCLMPNESLSGYWQLVNQVPNNKQQFDSRLKLSQIPQTVTSIDYDDLHNVYVIAQENLKLTSHFNKLKKNPHTEPMLHIGWRQPGLSKRESRSVYLVAGKNYTNRFKYDGSEKLTVQEIDMLNQQDANVQENADDNDDSPDNTKSRGQDDISNFMKKIQSGAVVDFKNSTLIYPKQNKLPDETWQLDGFIEVHLDHYLYVEGQFNFRELSKEIIDPEKFLAQLTKDKALESAEDELAEALSGEGIDLTNDENPLDDKSAESENKQLITINYLKNYSFKQTRKSYSGDLHYLDHPKMGILIQVRKYRH